MRDFEPAVSMMGRPTISVSSGHGKAFIPQAMVAAELDVHINGAGEKYEESRQADLEKEMEKEKEKIPTVYDVETVSYFNDAFVML